LNGQPSSAVRVVSEATLVERFGRPRDYRLVFSNGVFDLLHSGHVTSLETARGFGDALVVAVNSDRSTRRLKGPGRPVQPEADRARLVDAVTVFDDDTPARLIEQLLPDVLVKGADYSVEQIAGADAVLAAGGEVRLIEIEQGRSTSEIVRRLQAES
jgi:rfaE bifunctional protein nucleotidyltransferase chain/domain